MTMGIAFPIRAASPGDTLEAEEELDPDLVISGGGTGGSLPSSSSSVALQHQASLVGGNGAMGGDAALTSIRHLDA